MKTGHTQRWLDDRIENSRRAAKPRPCPKCGADTLHGPDHDSVACVVRVDTKPVTACEEVAALLTGRGSFDLVDGDLHVRYIEHIRSERQRYPVLIAHRCPGKVN